MSYLTTAMFWQATAERAIKTLAQTAAAILASDTVGLVDIDWTQLASIAGLAALLSVLTSIASGPLAPAGTPGLIHEPRPGDPGTKV